MNNQLKQNDMTQFYTPNGWNGSNYRCGMSVKEIAEEVRNYIKKEFAGQGLKFRVITKQGTSLYVCLMEAPYEQPFTKEWAEKHPSEANFTMDCQHAHCEGVLIPELYEVFNKIQTFVLSYVHDDSNGMIDYFDRNVYDHYYLGHWDDSYKYVPLKEESKKIEPIITSDIQIVDYSEKAIAIIGDTKPIKDTLKELGGKWNSRLTCGAGWIFSKSKETALKAALAI